LHVIVLGEPHYVAKIPPIARIDTGGLILENSVILILDMKNPVALTTGV
jgi:hypothetical protein